MTTTWINEERHPITYLLMEDGSYLLLETGDKIMLDQTGVDATSWTNETIS